MRKHPRPKMSNAAVASEQETRDVRSSIVDALRSLLAERRDADVISIVEKLVARNSQLEAKLAELAERKRKGETISKAQLDLFIAALKESEPGALVSAANTTLEEISNAEHERTKKEKEAAGAPPKQPPIRRAPPAHLRRIDNIIPVAESDRCCPHGHGELAVIGHEISEVLDLIPAEVIVRRDQREKRACLVCEGELVRAPMGDKVIAGGFYGSTLVANLLVGKYRDGLPLHRQQQQLERLGLKIPSSSMGDQITWATDLLRPLWRHSLDVVLAATIMHIDGTGLPVLDKEQRSARLGTLWGYVGDRDVAAYIYTSTGKKVGQLEGEIGPAQFLARRTGYTVADASNLFDESFLRTEIIEIGCNMHSRRYFVKALDAGDTRAALPLSAFKALYEIEESIRNFTIEAKREARQARSKPVYDEIISWCTTYKPIEPPSSALGRAIRYVLNHQTPLRRFLDDGVIPIDNGVVERLHRRVKIVARNSLFAGSNAGGERAAIAHSILGTCDLLGINPVAYLADVLPQLARGIMVARDVPRLMPAAWRSANPNAPPPPEILPPTEPNTRAPNDNSTS